MPLARASSECFGASGCFQKQERSTSSRVLPLLPEALGSTGSGGASKPYVSRAQEHRPGSGRSQEWRKHLSAGPSRKERERAGGVHELPHHLDAPAAATAVRPSPTTRPRGIAAAASVGPPAAARPATRSSHRACVARCERVVPAARSPAREQLGARAVLPLDLHLLAVARAQRMPAVPSLIATIDSECGTAAPSP